jgi:hypothetical protein
METFRSTHVAWRKSSRSGGQGSACVEVAKLAQVVATRDSKDPQGPLLCLTATAWTELLGKVRSGALDLG